MCLLEDLYVVCVSVCKCMSLQFLTSVCVVCLCVHACFVISVHLYYVCICIMCVVPSSLDSI